MPYLYYILLSLLFLSACQGEKKSKGNQNQVTVDNAQSRKTTGPARNLNKSTFLPKSINLSNKTLAPTDG